MVSAVVIMFALVIVIALLSSSRYWLLIAHEQGRQRQRTVAHRNMVLPSRHHSGKTTLHTTAQALEDAASK